MKKYLTDVRLGDLLLASGIISIKELKEAFRKVGNRNLHLGQMLVLCGCLKTSDLTAGIAAQSALKDKVVSPDLARRALSLASKESITFEAALGCLGMAQPKTNTNKLGALLVEANLIDQDQCSQALDKSKATGLPLGRVLVLNGILPERIIVDALEMQLRLRDGLITRRQAVDFLWNSACIEPNKQPDHSYSGQHAIRLGELLVRAGIVTRTDILNVLEVGVDKNKRMGELLIKFGFLTEVLLEAALNLQQMVDNSFLLSQQAVQCLAHIEATGVSVSQSLVDQGVMRFSERSQQSSANKPDSTFGFADQQKPSTRSRSRTFRLMNSTPNKEEPRLSMELSSAHKALISVYSRLAEKHLLFRDFSEAEWHFERILALRQRAFGLYHVSLVNDLRNLSGVLTAQRRFSDAESLLLRAIHILENATPDDSARLASCLNILGMVYFEQGKYEDSEAQISRALTLKEMHYPHDHQEVADTMRDYAKLLLKTGRTIEAEKMYLHVRSILQKQNESFVQTLSRQVVAK